MSAAERRAAYLDDLGRLLQQLTPVERIGVVDAVRTHIDTAFAAAGGDPSEVVVDRVLEELGSPEEVAERALAGEPAVPATAAPTRPAEPEPAPLSSSSTTTTPTTPPTTTPTRERMALADIPRMEWPEEAPPRPGLTRRWLPIVVLALLLLGSFFLVFFLPVVLLGVGIWLLWASPLWDRREKLIGSIASPLLLSPFLIVMAVAVAQEAGLPAGVLMLCAGAAFAALVLLAWLVMRGLARARAVDAAQAEASR